MGVEVVAKRPGGAEGHPLRGAWRIGSRGERGRRRSWAGTGGGWDGGEGLRQLPDCMTDATDRQTRTSASLAPSFVLASNTKLRVIPPQPSRIREQSGNTTSRTASQRRSSPAGNTSPLSQFAHGHTGCTSQITQPLAAMPTNMREYMGKRPSAHTDSKGLSLISRYRDFLVFNRGVSRLELCGKLSMRTRLAKVLIRW